MIILGMSKKLTIELSDELASFAQAKVAAGEYISMDEAVAAGVRNLQEQDAMIDRWVKEEVIPTYDRWKAGLEKTFSEEETFARVRAHIKSAAAQKAS